VDVKWLEACFGAVLRRVKVGREIVPFLPKWGSRVKRRNMFKYPFACEDKFMGTL
jgi:hypothetical protein